MKLPRAFYISRIDEENGNFEAVYAALREKYGPSVCSVAAPIKNAFRKVEGVVDLINRRPSPSKAANRRRSRSPTV
jgi:elongation factor G